MKSLQLHMNWNSAQDTRAGISMGTMTLYRVWKGVAAVNGGSLVQITRDIAHELHQLVNKVGLSCKCAVDPDGQIEGAVHPAELVVQQVLGHVQNDLRQEQGGQHDVEQQLPAGEVETAKAVGGNTGRTPPCRSPWG